MMTLLIVNDEIMTADTMKERINWKDYGIGKVYTCYDAEEARICIEDHSIDVMLCDIEMPGENGLSLLRWVREQNKEIECIFLTCHANFEYAQEALRLGCQDYILIPSKYDNIARTVQKVVKRIEEKREEQRYQEYGRYMILQQIDAKDESTAKNKYSREQVVEEAARYILSNLSDCELSVERIAEHFNFHPVYMNRIFKNEKKMAISQFIINERMKLAVILLEKGESNAFEVMRKVGYRQYTNFYNMFKKYYGTSPAHYKKK